MYTYIIYEYVHVCMHAYEPIVDKCKMMYVCVYLRCMLQLFNYHLALPGPNSMYVCVGDGDDHSDDKSQESLILTHIDYNISSIFVDHGKKSARHVLVCIHAVISLLKAWSCVCNCVMYVCMYCMQLSQKSSREGSPGEIGEIRRDGAEKRKPNNDSRQGEFCTIPLYVCMYGDYGNYDTYFAEN